MVYRLPAAAAAGGAVLPKGVLLVLLLMMLSAVAGCDRGDDAAAAGPPPPPAVTVAHPIAHEVIEWDEYTGRLEAPELVDVRPQVSGMIVETPFQEGALVKKGQLLFVIDERPFKAQLASAVADIAKAQAGVAQAEVNAERTQQAGKTNAVSAQDVTNAQAQLDQARAQLEAARAARDLAQVNLGWCRIVAPIAGRVGRKIVTVGNVVSGGSGAQGTLLTSIVSVDPVYCYVNVDEASVLKYQALAREGKRASARESRVPAFLQLSDEPTFPHEGYIDFVDNRVDPATGTLRARGVFPNKNGQLTPGFFGRMRVPGSGRYRAILVPDAAVVTLQNLRMLYTVGADNTTVPKTVMLGRVFGELRAIEKGITTDDVVVINGLLKVRPGVKVTPNMQTIPMASLAEAQTAPGSPTTQSLPSTRVTDNPANMRRPARVNDSDSEDPGDGSGGPAPAPASGPAAAGAPAGAAAGAAPTPATATTRGVAP